MALRPKEVCSELGISAATLRLWSNHFEESLSPGARSTVTEHGTYTQRRYEESDFAVFRRAQTLLGQGLTYEQVALSLQSDPTGEDFHNALPDFVETTRDVAVPASLPFERLEALLVANLEVQREMLQELRHLSNRPVVVQLPEPAELEPTPQNGRVDFRRWWSRMWG